MSYQVLARKWRPQRFEDVIGQEAITRTLANAIQQNRIGHAYLFSGARGVGKTTTARILAKALNCAQGPTVIPCDTCSPCVEIRNGNCVDVQEIDAASNRGIDEIRELREFVKYRPARDRFKVYIIDEVHMLTDQAFNALLKTLEEPPPHIVFILATTDYQKIPTTILSRCQHFTFRTIAYHDLVKGLEQICAGEKFHATPGALSLIARASEGSLRDAQSMLDQAVAFAGSTLEETRVRELLGLVPEEMIRRFTEALTERDSQKMFALVDTVVMAGFNLLHFLREAIKHIRNLMVVKVAGPDANLLELPRDEMEALTRVAQNFSEEDLLRFFQILSRVEGDLKWSTQPRFHLELGLMKLVEARKLMALEEFLAQWRGQTAGAATARAPATAQEFSVRPSSPAPTVKKNLNETVDAVSPPMSTDGTRDPIANASAPSSSEIAQIKQAVYTRSKFLASLLDHAAQFELLNSSLLVLFTPENRHFMEMLNTRDQIASLTEVCQNALGRNFSVKVKLIEESGPAEESFESRAAPPVSERRPETAEVKNDPLVKSFIEIFKADVIAVKKISH